MKVSWSAAATASFTDTLGRTFAWGQLKGKRIYLCGHGLHFLHNGYCTVPPGTELNFYQAYGRLMKQLPGNYDLGLLGFVTGKITWLTDRSFSQGQSSPDLTLVADDESSVAETERAIAMRPDRDQCYIFFANYFEGLPRFVPFRRASLPALQLREILKLLEGNVLEWTCCQQLMWANETSRELAKKLNAGRSDREAEFREGANSFGKVVRAGLRARESISDTLVRAYSLPASVTVDKHMEGAGRTGQMEGDTLVPHTAGGSALAPHHNLLNWGRFGANSEHGNLARRAELRTDLLKWRAAIINAQRALATDPQNNPHKRQWAHEQLSVGLQAADQLLVTLRAV